MHATYISLQGSYCTVKSASYLYVDFVSRFRWAASFLSFICRTISALKEVSCKGM